NPANAQPIPAMMKERTIAGPAAVAATGPVRTKIPVPMMAPMPRVTRFTGPSERLSECSPVSEASAMITLSGFLANSWLAIHSLPDSNANRLGISDSVCRCVPAARHHAPNYVDGQAQKHNDQARPCILRLVTQQLHL